MNISRAALTLGLAVVVLSGCAQTPAETSQPPLPTSTPSPDATQARETGLVAPAQPFGGDCGALMSDAEASALLGGEASLVIFDGDFAPEFSAELHAGMSCDWSTADYSAALRLVILPAEAVEDLPARGCVLADSERVASCDVEIVVNGTRVSGSMWVAGNELAAQEAAYAAFSALFEERANSFGPAPVPIPAVGAWQHPVDCAAVVAAADLSGVPGLGAGAVGSRFPFGGHKYASPAEDELEGGSADFPYCWIEGESATVTFVALGGARWLESTVSSSATPFVIDGFESAYTSPGQEGLTLVNLFDGPNWLHFQIMHTRNAKPLADALFAALDITATK